MQPFVIRFRKWNTRVLPYHCGNQEKVIDKLDVFRSFFAVHAFCGILQKNFTFQARPRILQTRMTMRNIPTASRNKKARIFRNQMVVRRRTPRRMIIRILCMFKNYRQPNATYKLVKFGIGLEKRFHSQNLPTKIPANQSQIHFDIAVPVDPHHVRVFIFPIRQMVAEQIQKFLVAAFFVKQRNMQQKLHAVHFPHMFRTSILVTANINFVRKRLWKSSPRR